MCICKWNTYIRMMMGGLSWFLNKLKIMKNGVTGKKSPSERNFISNQEVAHYLKKLIFSRFYQCKDEVFLRHQGNAGQNDNELPLCTNWDGNNKCWRHRGENGTLTHYWWECRMLQLLWKKSEGPHKVTDRVTLGPRSSTARYLPRRSENIHPHNNFIWMCAWTFL